MKIEVSVRSYLQALPYDEGLPLLFDDAVVQIGCDARCAVYVPHASVSALHASLRRDETGWSLVDEGSGRGTFVGEGEASVDGRRLEPGEPHRIALPLTWVRVGVIELLLTLVPGASPGGPHDSLGADSSWFMPSGDGDLGSPGPSLWVRSGPKQGARVEFNRGRTALTVGRSEWADLVLYDVDASKHHFAAVLKRDGLWVSDLGSKNGTWFRGERLEPGVEALCPPGGVLRAGQSEIVFEHPLWQKALNEQGPPTPTARPVPVPNAPTDVVEGGVAHQERVTRLEPVGQGSTPPDGAPLSGGGASVDRPSGAIRKRLVGMGSRFWHSVRSRLS